MATTVAEHLLNALLLLLLAATMDGDDEQRVAGLESSGAPAPWNTRATMMMSCGCTGPTTAHQRAARRPRACSLKLVDFPSLCGCELRVSSERTATRWEEKGSGASATPLTTPHARHSSFAPCTARSGHHQPDPSGAAARRWQPPPRTM